MFISLERKSESTREPIKYLKECWTDTALSVFGIHLLRNVDLLELELGQDFTDLDLLSNS